jgi:hypothetical protein
MGERLDDWLSEAPATGLRFAVIGPLAGALPWVALVLVGEVTRASPLSNPPRALQGVPVMLLFSYLFGVAPAFVTGLLVAASRPRLTPWAWCVLSGGVGLVVATLAPLLIGRLPETPAAWLLTLGSQLIFMGVPGLIGGLAAAWYTSREDFRHFRR